MQQLANSHYVLYVSPPLHIVDSKSLLWSSLNWGHWGPQYTTVNAAQALHI